MVYVGGMKHDAADFSNTPPERPVNDMSEDAFDAWMAALPPCPDIPTTPEEIEASVARARADVAAGRIVPHGKVARWLATWGTQDEKPMPREWLE